MTLLEGLLIVLALQLILFAVAEYEGSRLKVLNAKKLRLVCLIFMVGQMAAMGLGYLLSRLPFIPRTLEMSRPTAGAAAILLLVIGAFVFYKAWSWKMGEERLQELRYKRIALEAVGIALYTLVAGFACGLLNVKLSATFIVVFLCTILAVFTGLQTGYAQGDRFHRQVYGASSILFAITGIRILVRFL